MLAGRQRRDRRRAGRLERGEPRELRVGEGLKEAEPEERRRPAARDESCIREPPAYGMASKPFRVARPKRVPSRPFVPPTAGPPCHAAHEVSLKTGPRPSATSSASVPRGARSVRRAGRAPRPSRSDERPTVDVAAGRHVGGHHAGTAIAPASAGGTRTRTPQQRGMGRRSEVPLATIATWIGAGALIVAACIAAAFVMAKDDDSPGRPLVRAHTQYRYKKDCVFLVSPEECREVVR